jgi:hypothetical protein
MSERVEASIRDTFNWGTSRGKLAILTAVLVLITPTIATYVSPWFLVLLVVALVLSLAGLARASGGGPTSTPLARVGYAMAVNGVLLIVALFIDGILGDFIIDRREGGISASVGVGFTTVHILLGIGLLIVDDHRHAQRPDI